MTTSAVESICPGCGEKVTSYWVEGEERNGCEPSVDYVLVADTIWHGNCWDEAVAKYDWDKKAEVELPWVLNSSP